MISPVALSILKILAKGLFGRLLGYAAFGLGFWLLYQGISRPSVPLGVLGAALVPVAMGLMVLARKGNTATTVYGYVTKEDEARGDSLDGSSKGG